MTLITFASNHFRRQVGYRGTWPGERDPSANGEFGRDLIACSPRDPWFRSGCRARSGYLLTRSSDWIDDSVSVMFLVPRTIGRAVRNVETKPHCLKLMETRP